MARQPRQQPIGFYGKFQPTGVDTSASKRMEALAGLAGQVGGMAEQFGRSKADELAPAKAQQVIDEATTIDPKTGEVTREKIKMRSGTAWGKDAYNKEIITHNKAVEGAYLSNIDRDNISTINEIRDDNLDDPDKFITLANAHLQGVIGGIKPEFQGIVSDSLRKNIFTTFEKLQSKKRGDDIASSIVTQVDNAAQKLNVISLKAREGEDIGADQEELKIAIQALSELSPEQKRQEPERLRVLNKTLYESKVSGELNRIAENESPAIAFQKLQEIENNPQALYSADEWVKFINNEQAQLSRTKTLIDSTNQVATVALKNEITEYENKARLGFEIPALDQEAMAAKVKGTPAEAKIATANELAQFAIQPVSVRREMIAAAQKSGNATLTGNLINLNNQLQGEIANDAFGLGVKQGYVEYTTLNVSDLLSDTSEEAQQVFRTRKADAKLLSTIYGTNVSVFTKQEAFELTAALPNMSVDQKLRLSEILGEDSGVWAQISKDPASGAFAQVSALGDLNVSRVVFMGQEALATNNVEPVRGNDLDDANTILDDVVGNVYGNFDKESVRDAALNYYYGSKPKRGMFDQNNWKAAIQAVTGGIEKVRSYPTQLTGTGVDKVSAQDLDLYFSSFTADNLKDMKIEQITSEVTNNYTSSVRDFSQVFQENQTLDSLANERIEAVAGQGNYVIHQGGGVITKLDGTTMIFNVTKDQVETMKATARGKAMQSTISANLYGQEQSTQADEALGAFLGGSK